eukprot:scaffold39121_cov139-Skeletonema_marinoi.AAC.3
MADNNSNTATVAQLLHSGEEEDGCGDIEQGRNFIMSEHTDGLRSSSSSWAAAAITGGKSANTTSTTTTKLPLPLGGIEHVDVEDADAAPVQMIQQIADTELEEDNVAPIEDFSTTLQLPPPTQGAMLEQIEDDDDAAPRPFTDFERESRLKIDLENMSTDEEDRPPLPLSYQQDSSIYDNESIGGYPILQQMDEGGSPRDEEICNSDSLPVKARMCIKAYQHQRETRRCLFSKHTWWKKKKRFLFRVLLQLFLATRMVTPPTIPPNVTSK